MSIRTPYHTVSHTHSPQKNLYHNTPSFPVDAKTNVAIGRSLWLFQSRRNCPQRGSRSTRIHFLSFYLQGIHKVGYKHSLASIFPLLIIFSPLIKCIYSRSTHDLSVSMVHGWIDWLECNQISVAMHRKLCLLYRSCPLQVLLYPYPCQISPRSVKSNHAQSNLTAPSQIIPIIALQNTSCVTLSRT